VDIRSERIRETCIDGCQLIFQLGKLVLQREQNPDSQRAEAPQYEEVVIRCDERGEASVADVLPRLFLVVGKGRSDSGCRIH
jgi:hypothetical protein